jgi:hypothetical protein
MATLTFTAHCAKGHDRVEFTDRVEFETHMRAEHKARVPSRPAWINPNPHPWVAARPDSAAKCAEKLAAWSVAGQLDMAALFDAAALWAAC